MRFRFVMSGGVRSAERRFPGGLDESVALRVRARAVDGLRAFLGGLLDDRRLR
jgi:hypothetical protein